MKGLETKLYLDNKSIIDLGDWRITHRLFLEVEKKRNYIVNDWSFKAKTTSNLKALKLQLIEYSKLKAKLKKSLEE